MIRLLESQISFWVALLWAVFLIFGCASIKGRPHSLPISPAQISSLQKGLRSQSNAVRTFISTGSLKIQDSSQQIPATFLCVGTREPFRLKMEITHTWGLPLLNIVLIGRRVTVMDLYHHRTYNGQLGNASPILAKIPVLDKTLLWSIMRAYPEIMDQGIVSWSDEQRAVIVKKNGRPTQEIRFDGKMRYPSTVLYPQLDIEVKFSRFITNDHITYAKQVDVTHLVNNGSMKIKINHMLFNQSLNPDLFTLNP